MPCLFQARRDLIALNAEACRDFPPERVPPSGSSPSFRPLPVRPPGGTGSGVSSAAGRHVGWEGSVRGGEAFVGIACGRVGFCILNLVPLGRTSTRSSGGDCDGRGRPGGGHGRAPIRWTLCDRKRVRFRASRHRGRRIAVMKEFRAIETHRVRRARPHTLEARLKPILIRGCGAQCLNRVRCLLERIGSCFRSYDA
jgi:hypothetical protein